MMQEILNKVEEIQNKLENIGFPRITISTEINTLKPGVAGVAFPAWNKIIISVHYLNEFKDRVISNTVPHEICHLYVNKYYPHAKQNHGPEFRRLMQFLGLNGDTCHSMILSEGPKRIKKTKTRYLYLSTITNKPVYLTSFQHNKMVSGTAKYTLKTTGETLKYTGQVEKYI